MRIVLLPEARLDLFQAKNWYDRQREGLGSEFIDEVATTVERIRFMPEMYEVFFEKYRRAILRRFPYVLVYCVQPTLITVYGILHSAMDMPNWIGRLPKS